NALKRDQLHAVMAYVTSKDRCKSRMLIEYFGEVTSKNCGICSVCITRRKSDGDVTPDESKSGEIRLPNQILSLLSVREMNSREIQKHIEKPERDILSALRDLLDNNLITVKHNNQYTLNQ